MPVYRVDPHGQGPRNKLPQLLRSCQLRSNVQYPVAGYVGVGTLLARFKTRRNISAEYLLVSNQAVSSICRKGGGVCNGLEIRPHSHTTATASAAILAVPLLDYETPSREREGAVSMEWLLSPLHINNPYYNPEELKGLMGITPN